MSTDLTITFNETDVVPTKDVLAHELFLGDAMATFLAEVDTRARAKKVKAAPDLTTPKGRKELASIAFIPRKIKAAIEKAAAEFTKQQREIIDATGRSKKLAVTTLDALAVDLRSDLDAIEAEEARLAREREDTERQRKAGIDSCLAELRRNLQHGENATSEQLCGLIRNAEAWQLQETIYQERLPEANEILAKGIADLKRDLELALLREKDAAREAEETRVAGIREILDKIRAYGPKDVAASAEEWYCYVCDFTDACDDGWVAAFDFAEFSGDANAAVAATHKRLESGLAHAREHEALLEKQRQVEPEKVVVSEVILGTDAAEIRVVEQVEQSIHAAVDETLAEDAEETPPPCTLYLSDQDLAQAHAGRWLNAHLLPAHFQDSLAAALLNFAREVCG